ncbi:hypothetical protein QFC20_001143 [Naganishia adeliensis]|uniref:Uncharacterized protein n=1 Tax=Naganishia adeliensis TaxID=92952 RepID=A0ACC2WVW7_9TREE|nr:hypothetical protein QFC20_001143 [Naganishia adeliensis]
MKISIPTLPNPTGSSPGYANPLAHISQSSAIAHVKSFLDKGKGKTLVLTGAGVSVDSGIRAYRGSEGHYQSFMENSWNQGLKGIAFGKVSWTLCAGFEFADPSFLASPLGRDVRLAVTHWSRSYLGYPPVRDALPNPTHMYVAALQRLGLAPTLITQNVDRLHHKASPFNLTETDRRILELHGTLAFVHCLKNRHMRPRDEFQDLLGKLNPTWEQVVRQAHGGTVKTNPDGDVDLGGVKYDSFVVPPCTDCEAHGVSDSIVKPNVVFFGETISEAVKDRAAHMVAASSRVLVLGTSLATYSAFRLIKQALEAQKPVLLLSIGPSRADGLPGVEKIEMKAGTVLEGVLQRYLASRHGPVEDEVKSLMGRGVVKMPDNVPTPRAEG